MTITEELEIILIIEESTLEDGGEYTVRAYNSYGEATSTVTVTITREVPVFVRPLVDVTVAGPGAPATFSAAVRGVPEPSVAWVTVEGVEIVESER